MKLTADTSKGQPSMFHARMLIENAKARYRAEHDKVRRAILSADSPNPHVANAARATVQGRDDKPSFRYTVDGRELTGKDGINKLIARFNVDAKERGESCIEPL